MCSGTPTFSCCHFSYSLIRRRRARSSCTATIRLLRHEPKPPDFGYRGAFYAWESADSGEDVTPPFVVAPDGQIVRILTGEQEQHISADVAFGVWNYWHATGDDRFLVEAGAEILIETARFWASRAERGDDGRYHIRGVIGPDEYHETVDDNAYTNGMAQWNLEVAAEIANLVAERWPGPWQALSRQLGIEPEEPHQWQQVARDFYTGFDERTGLFEQFRGYFELGGDRPCGVRAANRTDGRAARSRAHSAIQDHQAA